jgi:hypothetical protein
MRDELGRVHGVTALAFNLGVLAALILIFAGVWILFGLGWALTAAGLFVWFTTLFVLSSAARSLMPRGDA